MADKQDILCFSSTDWDGVWGSRQQVMQRFAQRGYRILFVERPVGLEHLLRYKNLRQRKFKRWQEGLKQIQTDLWLISLPPLLPGRYYAPPINGINQHLTARWIKPYLKRLRISKPILWLYNPERAYLVKQELNEILSVYHCIDEFTVGSHGKKRQVIAQLEQELLNKVNLVFANSRLTFENKKQYHQWVYRVPSGADIAHFGQVLSPDFEEHTALVNIPKPRAGYFGHINERLDFDLLYQTAQNNEDVSFVFVGDTYPWTMQHPQLRNLDSLSNTYFLGKFSFKVVPSLVKGMDVCLLPYINNENAWYRSPLKLYEYLATGKPVVCSDHPEIRELADVVYIAENMDQFSQQLQTALGFQSQAATQKRLQVAQQHSWDNRVDQMEKIIQDMVK